MPCSMEETANTLIQRALVVPQWIETRLNGMQCMARNGQWQGHCPSRGLVIGFFAFRFCCENPLIGFEHE